MHVHLKRDFFAGDVTYARNSALGTEIPDEIDGREVIFFSEEKLAEAKKLMEEGEVPPFILLPRDARPWDGKGQIIDPRELVKGTKIKPKPLSHLTPKGKTFDED